MPPKGQKKQLNKKTAVANKKAKPVKQQPVVETPVVETPAPAVEVPVVKPKSVHRTFSVYYLSACGKEIADFGGRYIGKAPKQAGRKAFRQIIKYLKEETRKEIHEPVRFSIRETTQGHRMKDKSYHTFHYIGTPNKLAVPKEIEREIPANYKNTRVGLSMRFGGDPSKNVYPFICQKSNKLVFLHKNDYTIMKDNDAKFRRIAPKNTKVDKKKGLTQQLQDAVAQSAGQQIPAVVEDEPLVKPKTNTPAKPKATKAKAPVKPKTTKPNAPKSNAVKA
jgi:hypothetical protein